MNREELVRLIRSIAKEEAWEAINEVMDEHLDDYEHEMKPVEQLKVGCDQE